MLGRKRTAASQLGKGESANPDDDKEVTGPQIADAETLAKRKIIRMTDKPKIEDMTTGGLFSFVNPTSSTVTAPKTPPTQPLPASSGAWLKPLPDESASSASPTTANSIFNFGSTSANPTVGSTTPFVLPVALAVPAAEKKEEENTTESEKQVKGAVSQPAKVATNPPSTTAASNSIFGAGSKLQFSFGNTSPANSFAAPPSSSPNADNDGKAKNPTPPDQKQLSPPRVVPQQLPSVHEANVGSIIDSGETVAVTCPHGKLFQLEGKEWVERGAGTIRIIVKENEKGGDEDNTPKEKKNKARLIMHCSGTRKPLLNVNIGENFKFAAKEDRYFSFSTPLLTKSAEENDQKASTKGEEEKKVQIVSYLIRTAKGCVDPVKSIAELYNTVKQYL